jgi:hypothetical protein
MKFNVMLISGWARKVLLNYYALAENLSWPEGVLLLGEMVFLAIEQFAQKIEGLLCKLP